jgi:transcriptional regulator with XRE-family HTH domain
MFSEIALYTPGHDHREELQVMPVQRRSRTDAERFGDRLARFRQAAGYSQRELAAEVGISYRMVAYYEKETAYPPTHLLSQLAKVLGVSADQLLGIAPVRESGRSRDSRLWRRFKQLEKLPPAQRRPILQVLDAFLSKPAR